MITVLEKINGFLWGAPTLVMIIGVGLYISVRTGFIQFRLFGRSLMKFISGIHRKRETTVGVSQFRALCTALAATVGTGNIAGVAGAICIGGPGAVFWMWICGFIGMATKFAEATLSVSYRTKNKEDEYVGGPMYMIELGMGQKWKWLACCYCFFGVIAAFGVGNATQINAVVGGVNAAIQSIGADEISGINLLVGTLSAVFLGIVLIGGAKRVGAIAESLVPLASIAYLIFCIAVIVLRWNAVPGALISIIEGAFNPAAVTGGVLGSAFRALRVGASRGTFTNEAGMGTASIAHSAANAEHPVEQGMMGIVEVFLDTILICTMTALVILSSGVAIPYGTEPGVSLTMYAFSGVLGDWVNIIIAFALAAFAIATVLGWGLYGGRCAQYLFGDDAWHIFVWAQIAATVLGAVANTQTVWLLAEIVNALMAIPNLIVLAYLSPELFRQIKDYRSCRKNRSR